MNNYSETQAYNYTALAGMVVIVLNYFGVEVPAESIVVIMAGAVTLFGIVKAIIHRYKKGDVTIGGFRK